MEWLKELFGTPKPIIGMCHLAALPGDPGYRPDKGLEWVIERARLDLLALQNGGVDGVMFSNEGSLPYLTNVETITPITMARIIGELRSQIKVPFGVDVLWDPIATIELAVATGAAFAREVFTGVYSSDFGLWNTNCGNVIRRQSCLHGRNIKLLFNVLPESSSYLGERNIIDIVRSTIFNFRPDALCVSGLTAGTPVALDTLKQIKGAIPGIPILVNTGVRSSNVEEMLSIADGAVVGTEFKRDGYIWNEVDPLRVKIFMQKVQEFRSRV